ncbi:prion-inhibition and propagation-domain-containing protein [Triangularia verruculosa]|uniref:Prion-inhibition and propagation-domain-containing protein n=1 Tax=Triangularia verruculosa TaxID=2587418 RepID=A0AAN7AXR1_9PEZI|nr:prion-inhibition and propagation-domain-containing protein [Triangularia verruculosa]
MAEIAGLVIGVVGVAGVIGAFKDAVDLFNLVADSRNLGREFEVLDTKLDIEKTLLLQCADSVGLIHAGLYRLGTNTNYDMRLGDEATQTVIIRALNCIQELLSNAPELKQRYGQTEAPEGSQALATTQMMLSSPRWERFRANYRHWHGAKRAELLENERNTGKPIPKSSRFYREEGSESDTERYAPHGPNSAVKRARWVIRDRDKFERLDVEATRDLRQLKILQEASTGSSSAISKTAERIILETCKDRVLARLWFRKIDDRRESINHAHQRTLEWVLQPDENLTKDAQWDDLPKWLRSSSGIYWIVGKAGSGKSTLMKYLYMQSLTRTFLVEWAKGERLHICNYFFSNLGTTEQKSQEGLSRTFLYQILSAHRDIIPQVLPYMWRQIHDAESGNTEDIDLPSVAETTQAFKVLASNAQKLGRFCFLVDGLDEFVGNLMDAVAFPRNLASNSRIKIIVSSRPIPERVAAFGDLPGLNLQDLNQADIRLYVSEVLGGQEYMKKLVARYPDEGQELLNDVIKRSSGVFLWVVLACRSLFSGFAAHDRIAELRRRVNELPPELEDMFQLMLSKIDKRHREQGARLLKTCYAFHDTPWGDEARNLYTLGLALVEAYSSDFRPIYDVPEEEKKEMCLELEGRLRSRCGGLLEVDTTSAGCLCGFERGRHNQLIDSRVVFMHRSVFEFLRGETVWDLGVLRLAEDDSYDVATALSLYTLYVAKQSMASGNRTAGPDPCNVFWSGLSWTVLADAEPRGDPALFLNNMHSVLMSVRPRSSDRGEGSEFVRNLLGSINHVAHRGDPAYISFILAIHLRVVGYVREHLDSYIQANHRQRHCGCPPLLLLAIDRRLLSPLSPSPTGTVRGTAQTSSINTHPSDLSRTRRMVELLLSSGCNPNEPTSTVEGKRLLPKDFSVTTPWTIFVGWVRDHTL